MKMMHVLALLAAFASANASCDKNNSNSNGNGGNTTSPNCDNCGTNGAAGGPNSALAPTVNLRGGVGVLVLDTSGTTSLALKGIDNESDLDFRLLDDSSSQNSLAKVNKSGEVESAIKLEDDKDSNGGSTDSKNKPNPPRLPKILTIALAPNGEVYLHFAQPFVTTTTALKTECQSGDTWNTPGCMCQLFKVKGGDYKTLTQNDPSPDNLECIDSTHYVNSWQTGRNSVFQFDASSNAYYPGTPAGADGAKTVVYRRTADGSSTTEVINANICVNDYLVTKGGSVFYTGASCANGGGGNMGGDGGFFRYVAPANGSVREIARDWGNFVFEPVATSTADNALFFGPDPRAATTANWNSACLFRFDPTKSEASTAIAEVITCGADIWSWINMSRQEDKDVYGRGYNDGNQDPSAAWKKEYRSRCESEGQIFAGGGSQISAIKQDSVGDIYVIGKVRKKNKGVIGCNLQVKGAHCLLKAVVYVPGVNDPNSLYSTKSKCTAASGTWVDTKGFCTDSSNSNVDKATKETCLATTTNRWHYNVENYNNAVTSACYASTGSVSNIWDSSVDSYATGAYSSPTEGDAKIQTGWWNCNPEVAVSSGDQWTNEYKSLAKVKSSTKSLVMLSGVDEQATNLWLVNDVAYFSTYNTSKGKYFLKRWDATANSAVSLAENFEAYHIENSGDSTTVYYDGLDFSNNSYSFGTMLTASPYTRTQKTGLTGIVKTIVTLPK